MKDEQREEIEELKLKYMGYKKPVLTDPSCRQYRVDMIGNYRGFIFSEYETDPDGRETLYTEEIRLNEFTNDEIVYACEAYGSDPVDTEDELIAEYLFELRY